MSVTPYTPGPSKIVHESRVDFRQRVIQSMIHIVQYDKSLPIIAVELYSNGQKWTLPSDANVKVRWGKRDHTYVYLDVLGCNAERTVVYFEIVEQMTVFYGEHNPVLEVIIGDSVACSSYIPFYIDRNPIQRSDVESEVVPSVVDMLEAEIRSKQNILVSGTNIKTINGQSILGTGDLVISVDTNLYYNKTEVDNLLSAKADSSTLASYYTKTEADNLLSAKQPTLVSGTNIKTINNQSLLGSGNLSIKEGVTIVHSSSDFTVDRDAIIAAWPNVIYQVGNGIYTPAGYVESSGKYTIKLFTDSIYGTMMDLKSFTSSSTSAEDTPYFITNTWQSSSGASIGWIPTTTAINAYLQSNYQLILTSGTNIKTINGQTLLGSGNLVISTDLSGYYTKTETDNLLSSKVDSSALASYYTKTETDNLLAAKADDSNVVHLSGGGTISPSSFSSTPNLRTDLNGSTIYMYDNSDPYRYITLSLSNSELKLNKTSTYHVAYADYSGFTSKWGRYSKSGYRYSYDGIHGITNDTETNLYSFPNSSGTIALTSDLDSKQDTLVSGTNIKTVNGYSLLGSGNVDVVKKVVLYSGASGYSVLLNTNYTPATDFDIVLVFLQYNGTDTQQSHCIIDASWMNNINNSYNYNIHENIVKLQYNPDTHYLWNANNNCQIYKVIGLKFNNA